jgi:hypothetical protein
LKHHGAVFTDTQLARTGDVVVQLRKRAQQRALSLTLQRVCPHRMPWRTTVFKTRSRNCGQAAEPDPQRGAVSSRRRRWPPDRVSFGSVSHRVVSLDCE